MSTAHWIAFPHPLKSYVHEGAALAKHWERLHTGDAEPFPDEAWVVAMYKAQPALKKQIGDADAAAETLRQAWTAHHRGAFEEATRLGESLGALGATVANKSEGIYATYLVEDADTRRQHFENCAKRAEAAIAALPQYANAHYFHAFALGRYSQAISIMKALSQGIAGKVKASLDTALKLAPNHAEAHVAMAVYHAEVIAQVGGMIGGLTYGVKAEKAIEHLDTARKLAPHAPVVHLETGNVLLKLYGKKKIAEAKAAYEAAAKCKAMDAMERLDVEQAKAELEG